MKISHVRINSILGIDELEFGAGGFNEIAGQNGTGKTSVLEAIKAVLQDGHDATLLRKGADKGEVVLVLDDGTEIRKRVTEKSSPRDMRREGGKVSRPAEAIRALTDMLSVNPIDFLRAPKKDRVRVLLEAMPLTVDADKLTEISGIPVSADDGQHALAVIDMVRKQVFNDRTGTNRAVREKDATINQLRAAMPEAPEGSVEGSEDELNAKLGELDAGRDAELARITTKLEGLRADNHKTLEDIRSKAQEEIDRIKAKAQADAEAANAELARIEGLAGMQRERTIAAHADNVGPIKTTLASIRQNRSSEARRQQAMETVATMETELAELKDDAERQTAAIGAIDDYKASLLSALPIPGVEIVDGEVIRDGVAFDRLNTAQQVDIAVEVAKLRAGELKICCVDGVELLDSKAFDAFRERAIASGLQLFVSRVSDDAFAVKTA